MEKKPKDKIKKEKKPLTLKQKEKRLRVGQWSLFGCEFVSTFAPYGIMAIVNHEEWFYQADGWKVSLGGGLAFAVMGLGIFLITKRKEGKHSKTDGFIALIVGWFAFALVFMLLASIINELATIMFYGGLGLLGAFGFDLGSTELKNQADAIQKALNDAGTDALKEQAKKENQSLPVD